METTELKSIVSSLLDINQDDITDIRPMKKGMTNDSYLFDYQGSSYVFRLLGKGTEELIYRNQEADVYECIKDLNISYISYIPGYPLKSLIKDSSLLEEYESKYGPINTSSNTLDNSPFRWAIDSFPWNEGGM